MALYARIDSGLVMELFTTENDISKMFHPALVWVDVTDADPVPECGYLAELVDGQWQFFEPPDQPPL